MKKIVVSFFVIISVLFIDVTAYAKETPDELLELYAQSAVLMDADSGRILFGKNSNQIRPMASTTKIMTCILALEKMQKNQICQVSDLAAKQPKVHLGVKKGERYYMKDLLYSLMLESHNDSAVIIAESIGGSVEAFANMMNQKANEIGCTNTYFVTPNGLDGENEKGKHSTTAEELALIMRYCIRQSPKRDSFIEITQKDTHQFANIEGTRNFVCNNHNTFMKMMDGVVSGKTGFTNASGYCYVAALENKGRTFIVTLLACGWPNNKTYKWKDAKKILEYALQNYEYKKIQTDTNVSEIIVTDAFDPENPFEKNVTVKTEIEKGRKQEEILLHKNEKIYLKKVMKSRIRAPLKSGEKVGILCYMLNGDVIRQDNIVIIKDIDESIYKEYIGIVRGMLLL